MLLMLKKKIFYKKQELDELLDSEPHDSGRIQLLSEEIDLLVLEYYTLERINKESDDTSLKGNNKDA